MKHKIFKNRFFYTTIVFLVFILVQTARFVYSEVVPGWSAPTAPPTGGQPAAAIDTSGATQFKKGNLYVGSGNQYTGIRQGAGIVFSMPTYALDNAGEIKMGDNGKLMGKYGGEKEWFTIGSGGGGGGESFWKAGTGGIFYGDGKAGIGSSVIKTSSGSGSLQVTSPAGVEGGVLVLPSNKIDSSAVKLFVGDDAADTYFYLSRGGIGTSPRYDALVIDSGGRVGVKTMPSTSGASLRVAGGAEFVDSAVFYKNVTIQGNVNVSGSLTGGRVCPEGTTMLDTGVCIQNKVSETGTKMTWQDASQYCANFKPAGRLCSYGEWLNACVDKFGDANFVMDAYEFVNAFTSGDKALVTKKSTDGNKCKNTSEKSITEKQFFRCCFY